MMSNEYSSAREKSKDPEQIVLNLYPNSSEVEKLIEKAKLEDEPNLVPNKRSKDEKIASASTLTPPLPQLLAVQMPSFERSYRNTILRPLTATSSNNEIILDEGMGMAASTLRSLMRCIYVRALSTPSNEVLNPYLSRWGNFSDAKSEEATRKRLLPKTIFSILSLRSEDSSSNSRRNNSITLSTRGEIIVFHLLLDFVELTAEILSIQINEDRPINTLDYLGPDWLESFCKVFGELHYWEYNEEDWRGVNTLIGDRNRNSSLLPCFYRFYGHNRTLQESSEDTPEKDPKVQTSTNDSFSRISLLLASDDSISFKEETIIISYTKEDVAVSVSSYLLVMAKYFFKKGGLKALANAVNATPKSPFRATLGVSCISLKIMRALVSILWFDESTEAAVPTEISSFRDTFLQYITSLQVGTDIISGDDRQIIFSLLDSLCEHPNQTLQNALVAKLALDLNISRKLRLDTIWKMLSGSNTTLQSRIFGLNEIRTRISDSVQELDEARHRAEEFDLREQGRIRDSKDRQSPTIVLETKIESIPRLEILPQDMTNSPTDSNDDNLSTAVYAGDEISGLEEDQDDDDDNRWTKTGQKDRQSPTIVLETKIESIPRLEILPQDMTNSPTNSNDDNLSTAVYADDEISGLEEDQDNDDDNRWTKTGQTERSGVSSFQRDSDGLFNKFNNTVSRDQNALKKSNTSHGICLEKKEKHAQTAVPENLLTTSFEYFLVESAEREINYLISFVTKEHSFLSTLLSPSYLHPELLKRSIIIPSFLAEQGELTSDDIKTIWSAAMTSSHESIQHAVYELLIGLLEKFEREQLIMLGSLLETLECQLISEKYLALVHHFAGVSLGIVKEIGNEKRPLGVDLLWKLGQEPTPLKAGLHETVVSYLLNLTSLIVLTGNDRHNRRKSRATAEMINKDYFDTIHLSKMWLIEGAVRGIKEGKSSVPCQLVINSILRLWPLQEGHQFNMERREMSKTDEKNEGQIQGKNKESPHQEIGSLKSRFYLVKKYDLVSLIVNDLCRYVQHVKVIVNDDKKLGPTEIDSLIIPGQCYNHVVNVSSRFEFLKFILGICFNTAMEEHRSMYAPDPKVVEASIGTKHHLKSAKDKSVSQNSSSFKDQKIDDDLPIINVTKIQQEEYKSTDLKARHNNHMQSEESARVVDTDTMAEMSSKPKVNVPRPPIQVDCSPLDPIIIEDDDDSMDSVESKKNDCTVHKSQITFLDEEKILENTSLASKLKGKLIDDEEIIEVSKSSTQYAINSNSEDTTSSVESERVSQELSPLMSDHIELLWSNFVENCTTSQESALCLSALHSILATSQCCLSIRMHLAPILFHYCLNRLSVVPMRGPAFDLFALAMTSCNLIQGKYELYVSTSSGIQNSNPKASNSLLGHQGSPVSSLVSDGSIQVRLASFDVSGIDKLWEISLYACDEDVAKKAMSSLSTIYTFQSISEVLKLQAPIQQRHFVQSCMSVLKGKKSYHTKQEVGFTNLIKSKIRCLRLISIFADAIMRHTLHTGVNPVSSGPDNFCTILPSISHGYTTSTQSQKLVSGTSQYFYVRVQPPYGLSSFEVMCSLGSTVGYLRQIVRDKAMSLTKTSSGKTVTFAQSGAEGNFDETSSHHVAMNNWKNSEIRTSSDYRLIHQGKELSKDNFLLTSCGIVDGSVVHCWPRMSTKAVMEKNIGIVDIDEKSRIEKRKRQVFESTSSDSPKKVEGNLNSMQQQPNNSEILSSHVSILSSPLMAAIAELVQSQHINVFFSLLCEKISKDHREIRELVWDILQLLPTDPKMKTELKALTAYSGKNRLDGTSFEKIFSFNTAVCCDWDRLLPPILDPESSFRLLYALQLVQSFVAESLTKGSLRSGKKLKVYPDVKNDAENSTSSIKQHNSSDLKREENTWSHDFFWKGGVTHLINILLNIDRRLDFEHLQNDDATDLEDFLFSSNLLYILRCTHRLQQLLVFFLEGSSELQSTLISKISKKSIFGPLFSHTLRTIHWSVCIQRTFWDFRTQSDGPPVAKTHDVGGPNLHPDFGLPHPSSTFDFEQSPASDGSLLESNAYIRSRVPIKKKIHSADVICVESSFVLQQSLMLLRIVASTAPFSTLIHNLIPMKTLSENQTNPQELLSNALASALVISPCDNMRKLALSTFQSIFVILTSDQDFKGLSKKTLAIQLLAEMIDLIPLGLDEIYMEKCACLFDVICDLLSRIWKKFSDDDKKKMSMGIDEELRDITEKENNEFYEHTVIIGQPPSNLSDVESIGKLLNWIIRAIISVPIREQRRKRYPIDSFLVGLLKLSEQILQFGGNVVKEKFSKNSAVFIRYLFFQCLFSFPSASNNGPLSAPKCKTFESRDAALNVLKVLCEDCPINIQVMTQLLLNSHHSYQLELPRKDLSHEWHFDPLSRDKGSTGHVGLRNLGATCYLNSLLQQFFLIKPLRNGLLSCERSYFKSKESENDLLHQLQLLFANLLLSERRDYDTSDLCLSIKGYDGNPIRPGEQQDVVEFFNLFGDRLETSLKSFEQRFLLQDVFGGELSHIITCQECKHRSERSEDCLSLSLDVKGKSNVLESLKLYIQGEALDGDNQYYCEKCQAKRDSLKMCCVSSLPNNLILHLKRFEFDLEIMRKIKVNDRFEYPLELNMKPFTKEAQASKSFSAKSMCPMQKDSGNTIDVVLTRPESYYQYYLRGVLVHSGTADSGHYYSLARESGTSSAPDDPSRQPWFCFNDSCVTPFDLSTLPSATFGGIKVGTKYDHLAQKMVRTETPKPYSAYLLIYERKHIENKPRVENFVERMQQIPHNISTNNHNDSSAYNARYKQERKRNNQHVPEKIFNELWQKNDRFLRDQVMFSPEYCKWLLEVSKMPKNRSQKQFNIEMMQVMTHFLLETLIHGKDRQNHCETVVSLLCTWYEENVAACEWFLEVMTTTKKFWVEKILLHCPVIHVRQGFVKLLSVTFRKLAPHECDLYTVETNETVGNEKKSNGNSSFEGDPSDVSDDDEMYDADDDIITMPFEFQDSTSKSRDSKRIGRCKWWKSKSILARFVGSALLELLPLCERHWRRFDQLFESILVFATIGPKESLYLIRCGVILRMVDIYLGDNGGVPQKSLIREPCIERNDLNTIRSRMGDKYTKPNMSFLLSTLNILIRSAIAIPEEDDNENYEDSDDDFAEKLKELRSTIQLQASKDASLYESKYHTIPPTLNMSAFSYFNSLSLRFELPRRDSSLISTKQFLQTILEDSSLTLKETDPNHFKNQSCNQMSSNGMVVTGIICHICFNNLELTKVVCEISRGLLEDRKADEFLLSLESLLSMLKINDSYVSDRINLVMDTLAAGIVHNLNYEKESTMIIDGVKNILNCRMKGVKGTLAEVSLHQRIIDCLDNDILDWFQRENTSGEVRQSIVGLIQSLLSIQYCEHNTEQVSSENAFQCIEYEIRTAKTATCGKSRSHPISIVDVTDAYESNPSPDLSTKNISKQADDKADDDVIVLGVVNNTRAQGNSMGEDMRIRKKETKSANQPDKESLSFRGDSVDLYKMQPNENVSRFPYVAPEIIKERVFCNLINMFDIVYDALQSQASHNSSKASNRNSYSNNSMHNHFSHGGSTTFVDTSVFAVYFETLRHCLTGAGYEKRRLFHKHGGIHGRLVSLLWKIDEEGRAEQRPSADTAKGEIIVLYRRMIQLHRHLGKELVLNFCFAREIPIDVDAETNIINTNEQERFDCIERDYISDDNANYLGQNKVKKRRINFPREENKNVMKRKVKKKENSDCLEDEIDSTSKLLEIYVTSIKENETYNSKYMHYYYELLLLLADRHSVFKRKMLDHNNWRWSLKAFVLGSTGHNFGLLSKSIFRGTIKYIKEDGKFRNLIVSELIVESYEGGRKSLLTQTRFETRSIYLFCIAIKCVEIKNDEYGIISRFIDEHQGMHQLSYCISKFHKMLESEDRVKTETNKILEGLSLSLESLWRILKVVGLNKIRTLISKWDEADDMNFLCCQLVTSEKQEWDSLLEAEYVEEGKKEYDRVIEYSSGILSILASVDAVAEAEADSESE